MVDKKQSEFSLKKMIKRLHIKEPAQHVLAILGKRYCIPNTDVDRCFSILQIQRSIS